MDTNKKEIRHEKEPDKNHFDTILSKYVSVWIWSILFGGTATITLTLFNLAPRGRDWNNLSIVFIIILLYGLAFVFMSWYSLYKYLIFYIIPKFFKLDEKRDDDYSKMKKSPFYLRRSFLYLMGGLVAIFAMKISELLLESSLFQSGNGF